MSTFHFVVLEFKPWFHFDFQLSANAHPQRLQLMPRVFGSLPPLWEVGIELLTYGFGLAQTQLLWAFGK